MRIRFLRKQGTDMAIAVTAGGLLDSISSVLARVLIFVVAVRLTPDRLVLAQVSPLGVVEAVFAGVAAIGVVVGIVFGFHRSREHAVLR